MMIVELATFFVFVLILVWAAASVYHMYLGHLERFERLRQDTQERIAIAQMETAKYEAEQARYTMMLSQPEAFHERYPAGRLN